MHSAFSVEIMLEFWQPLGIVFSTWMVAKLLALFSFCLEEQMREIKRVGLHSTFICARIACNFQNKKKRQFLPEFWCSYRKLCRMYLLFLPLFFASQAMSALCRQQNYLLPCTWWLKAYGFSICEICMDIKFLRCWFFVFKLSAVCSKFWEALSVHSVVRCSV